MLGVPRDGEHLVRLVLLFAAGVLLLLVVRALFVPAGFGDYGHFRTGAIADAGKRQNVFAGRAACAECHGEVLTALAKGSHAKVGCESCHGALAAQVADADKVKPVAIEVVELCSLCHAKNQARPKNQPQVDPGPHAEGNVCTECHDAHAPAA